MIAKGVDENGKEFEEKININDIALRNASYVEMSALEAYYDVDRGNGCLLYTSQWYVLTGSILPAHNIHIELEPGQSLQLSLIHI